MIHLLASDVNTSENVDKQIIIGLLNSYNFQNGKIFNVKVAGNVSFQFDSIMEKKEDFLKKSFNKSQVLARLISVIFKKTGMFVDLTKVTVKDNGSEIVNSKLYNDTYFRVNRGAKISVIITVKKDNLVSPNSITKLKRIVDKKIERLETTKNDPKTLLYTLTKLFPKCPKDLVIKKDTYSGSSFKTTEFDGKTGFRLDPDNEYGSYNANPISDISNGYGLLSGSESPFEVAYIERLKEFYASNYTIVDLQSLPDIGNNFSKFLKPMIYVFIK